MSTDEFEGIEVTIRRNPILEEVEFFALKPTLIEKMCRNKLEIFIKKTPKAGSILRHMRHWCIENCQSFVYIVDTSTFYFEDGSEAVAFKLRWC